jgi:hypothetical protein
MAIEKLDLGRNGTKSINKRILQTGTPTDLVVAQGTLTVDAQVTADDTMTVDTTDYTFVAAGTADAAGEINLGADLAGTQENIVKALKGTDGYNVLHPTVTCAAAFGGADDLEIEARVGGTAGNAIATTETFTAVTNVFDAATLGTTQAGAGTYTPDVEPGSMRIDATNIYICTGTNGMLAQTWRKIAHSAL